MSLGFSIKKGFSFFCKKNLDEHRSKVNKETKKNREEKGRIRRGKTNIFFAVKNTIFCQMGITKLLQ